MEFVIGLILIFMLCNFFVALSVTSKRDKNFRVVVSDEYVYVVRDVGSSLTIIDVSNKHSPVLLSKIEGL